MSEIAEDTSLPAPLRAFLTAGGQLESIRVDSHGRWWHEGEPFKNERLSALFSRSVARSPGGTWVLRVGRYTYPIEVTDTAFFVVAFDPASLAMEISDGTTETLDPRTLRSSATGGVTCRIRDGEYRARFLRGPYHTLVELLTESAGEFVLIRDGETFVVGPE